MELYLLVGTIIISSCLILSFYMYKKEQIVTGMRKERMTNQEIREVRRMELKPVQKVVDEKAFVKNMSEEQAMGYFKNSIFNEHELEQGETAKSFLMERCTIYWPENFPYNYQ